MGFKKERQIGEQFEQFVKIKVLESATLSEFMEQFKQLTGLEMIHEPETETNFYYKVELV